MANIPRDFGIVFDSNKVAPAKPVKARPVDTTHQAKPVEKTAKDSRKPGAPSAQDKIGDASIKRSKATPSSSSLVVSEIGSPAATFIKDEDIKRWKALSAEEENQAMIKASAQLLIASLGRAQRLEKEGERLKKAESESSKSAKQVKDLEQKLKKTQEHFEATEREYKEEANTHLEINLSLSTTIDNQSKELEDLRARLEALTEDQQNGWADEKARIKTEEFGKGFQFYATGFLAQDPDYDFTKFGEDTVQWINAFKISDAAAIKARRIQLGLEEAEEENLDDVEGEAEDKGAPGDEKAATPTNTSSFSPLQVDESGFVHTSKDPQTSGAPEDSTLPPL